MKIRTFKSVDADKYKVSVATEDWSELDLQLMMKFGEPEIDLGGHIVSGQTDFTLDSNLVKIKTESPFVQSFDTRDREDAQICAEVWATRITGLLTDAITTLRNQSDGFSGEAVTTV